MDDRFDVKLLSSEANFIHNFGVNRGYTLSYSKVDRCLFLSVEAKQTYKNICQYAYGDKRDCYPSLQSLMVELGICKNALLSYIRELEFYKFIDIERRTGQTHVYHIQELHKVPVLILSELVWGLKVPNDQLQPLIDRFYASDWFKPALEDPENSIEAITRWFTGGGVVEKPVEKPVETAVKTVLPKAMPSHDDLQIESTEEKKPKKSAKDYKELTVDKWTPFHFCQFFSDIYQEKYNEPHMIDRKSDPAVFKRLLTAGRTPDTIKTHIVNFIHNFQSPSIRTFGSGFIQTSLDEFLNSGRLPSDRYNRKPVSNPAPVSDEWADVDEAFKK